MDTYSCGTRPPHNTDQQRLDRLASRRDGLAVMVARDLDNGAEQTQLDAFRDADRAFTQACDEVYKASKVRGVA